MQRALRSYDGTWAGLSAGRCIPNYNWTAFEACFFQEFTGVVRKTRVQQRRVNGDLTPSGRRSLSHVLMVIGPTLQG